MPRIKRLLSVDTKRRRIVLKARLRRAKETEEERKRRNKETAERQRRQRALETPEEARRRRDFIAARARQKRAAKLRKRIKEAEELARIQRAQKKARRRKPISRKKKSNHTSETPRQRFERESLMKYISYNPPSSLAYGSSCGETITSDITNQHVEDTKPSLGHLDVPNTTIKNEDVIFDPVLMVLKSNVVQELHIVDDVVVESMISEDENVESTLLQNQDGALQSNINDRLIAGSEESRTFQCKKEPSSESGLDKDFNTLPESPVLTQGACHSSNHAPTVHIDFVIPHCPESSQMNSFIRNQSSSSSFNKQQSSKNYELGARSSVVEKPLSPVIVIKQEILESELNSEPQQCSNSEPQHCPNPEPRHCPDPELRHCPNSELQHCPDPALRHCPDPKLQHCSNPKCLEYISQLKKKVAGLEFQLKASLKMSGVMSLKVQNALEDKKILEYKLRKAEQDILYFKQKYNEP